MKRLSISCLTLCAIFLVAACDKVGTHNKQAAKSLPDASTHTSKTIQKKANTHARNARLGSIVRQGSKPSGPYSKPHNSSTTKSHSRFTPKMLAPHDKKAATPIFPAELAPGHFSFGGVRKGKELNIAVLLPISGEHARMGRSMLDAVQLASAELGTGRINIIAVDAGATSESAVHALDKVKIQVDAIVGPIFIEQVQAVSQYAKTKNVAHLAFVNDRELTMIQGMLMFGMPLEEQLSRIISYAIHRGVKKIYTIVPDNSIGSATYDVLSAYKNSNELDDFVLSRYKDSPKSWNYSEAVQVIRDNLSVSDPDVDSVLLLPQFGAKLRRVARYIETVKDDRLKKLKVLCGSNFHDRAPYSITWDDSPWFADVATSARTTFNTRFKNTYRYEPHYLSSLAYDAVALILAVVKQGPDNELIFDPKAMTNKTGFEGINGVFRFNDDGSGERLLSVFKISSSQTVEIDKALNSFE